MKTQYEKEIINESNNGSHSEKNTNMLLAAFITLTHFKPN